MSDSRRRAPAISSPVLAGAPFASSASAVAPPATGLLGGTWPSNPFSPTTPPLLASAAEIDASRVSAPLIRLRDHVPSFRRRTLGRRRSRDDSDGGAAAGWRERWGPIVLGLGAMLAVFAVIGGLLLIPEAP